MTCEILDSDSGDCVRNSPGAWDDASLMAGVLISKAVSQRSRSNSTIRACGRRIANDRARVCPKDEVDLSLDRPEGVAGDAVPEDDEGDAELGPIDMPLYSAWGGAKVDCSPGAGLLVLRASSASRTLTIA